MREREKDFELLYKTFEKFILELGFIPKQKKTMRVFTITVYVYMDCEISISDVSISNIIYFKLFLRHKNSLMYSEYLYNFNNIKIKFKEMFPHLYRKYIIKKLV